MKRTIPSTLLTLLWFSLFPGSRPAIAGKLHWCQIALSQDESNRPARAVVATQLFAQQYRLSGGRGHADGWRAATIAAFADSYPSPKGASATVSVTDGLEAIGRGFAADAGMERIFFEESTGDATRAIAIAPFALSQAGLPRADQFAFVRLTKEKLYLHVPSTSETTMNHFRQTKEDEGKAPRIDRFHYYDFPIDLGLEGDIKDTSLSRCQEGDDECLRVWALTDRGISFTDVHLSHKDLRASLGEYEWSPPLSIEASKIKAVSSSVVISANENGVVEQHEITLSRGKARHSSRLIGQIDGFLVGFDAAEIDGHREIVAIVHTGESTHGQATLYEWSSDSGEFRKSKLELEPKQKPLSVAIALAPADSVEQWEQWRRSQSLTAGWLAMLETAKPGNLFVRRLLLTVRSDDDYGLVGAVSDDKQIGWRTPPWYYIDRDTRPEEGLRLVKARFDVEAIERVIGSIAGLTTHLWDRLRSFGFGSRFEEDPESYPGAIDAITNAWYERLVLMRDLRFIPSRIRPNLREEGFKGLGIELLVYQLMLYADRYADNRLALDTAEDWEKTFKKSLNRTSGSLWKNVRLAVEVIEKDLSSYDRRENPEDDDELDFGSLKPQTTALFLVANEYLQRPSPALMRAFVRFARERFPSDFATESSDPFSGTSFLKALDEYLKNADPLYAVRSTEDLLQFLQPEVQP